MRMSYWTVRNYAKDPEFMGQLKLKSQEIYNRLDAELAANKEDMKERLERASEEALEMMIELARSSTGVIKLKSCQDLLDRDTRVSRTKRLEGEVGHDFISPLFLVHAAKVGREIDVAPQHTSEARNIEHVERDPTKALPLRPDSLKDENVA